MIDFTLDEDASVLHVRPTGPLQEEDFRSLAAAVDPYIERTGKLHALVVETAEFPGWADLASALGHMRFVHDHHRKIDKVAIVTDSPVGDAVERLGAHFIDATVKRFSCGKLDEAEAWAGAD